MHVPFSKNTSTSHFVKSKTTAVDNFVNHVRVRVFRFRNAFFFHGMLNVAIIHGHFEHLLLFSNYGLRSQANSVLTPNKSRVTANNKQFFHIRMISHKQPKD